MVYLFYVFIGLVIMQIYNFKGIVNIFCFLNIFSAQNLGLSFEIQKGNNSIFIQVMFCITPSTDNSLNNDRNENRTTITHYCMKPVILFSRKWIHNFLYKFIVKSAYLTNRTVLINMVRKSRTVLINTVRFV